MSGKIQIKQKCKMCGEILEPDALFCHGCGVSVAPVPFKEESSVGSNQINSVEKKVNKAEKPSVAVPRLIDSSLLYTDPQTSLIWSRDGNIAGKSMKWQEATDWVKNLNYSGFYGYWRLPTKEELEYMVRRGGKRPSEWFNSNGFTNVQTDYYWSSTTYSYLDSHAWGVGMYSGHVDFSNKDSFYGGYIWPVRG